MKKKIFMLLILFIILATTLVQASSNATLTLKSNSSNVKPGSTFTVTMHIICPDGINGFSCNYSYDINNLELINRTVCDSSKWSNLGQNNEIAIISNTSSIIKDSDLFELTFKVKENATVNTKSSITLSNIMIDSDKPVDSKIYPTDQELTVTITSSTPPTTTKPNEKPNTPNNNNKPGTTVKPPEEIKDNANNTVETDKNQVGSNTKPSEEIKNTNNTVEKDKNQTVSTINPSEDIKKNNNTIQNNSNKNVVISNSNTQRNVSVVNDKIPYTGSNITFGLLSISLVIIVFTLYVSYRKYKNVN